MRNSRLKIGSDITQKVNTEYSEKVTPIHCVVRLRMCCPSEKLNKYCLRCRQLVISLVILDPILWE